MNSAEISKNIFELSVTLEDGLFEEIWEIPNGVSIHSYIVKGEKTAIIDGVAGWDGMPETLLELLGDLHIKPENIDYLIINHMEPDHSGWIENFRKITTDFKVVCTKKAAVLLEAFYGHNENMEIVKNGDTLDLGDDCILSFHEAPFIHWPETMMTFEEKSGTLFPCDMYGGFGLFSSVYDDKMTKEEHLLFETECLRYYSNVMTTFSSQAKKAIEKTEALPVKMIAPAHGPIWRSNPQKIIDMYKRYTEYGKGNGEKNELTILWGSMYGMTEKMVNHIIPLLEEHDIIVHNHRLPVTGLGQVLTSVISSSAVIVASPTYENNMFPPVAMALEELGRKKINNRLVMSFGSFGWAEGMKRELDSIIDRYKMKWTVLSGHKFKGSPRDGDKDIIEKQVLDLINEMKK